MTVTFSPMNAKLDTGRVFERIFSFYGSQFTLLIPAALVLFIPVALINGLLLSSGGFLVALLSAALSLIATLLVPGHGRRGDARHPRRPARPHDRIAVQLGRRRSSAPLIGVGILAGIGIAIGFVLLIIPGLFLLTIWAVIVPVIVIERAGVFDSFGRSRELVRGSGWQVFGVIVVIFLVTFIVRGDHRSDHRRRSATTRSPATPSPT